jgi:hypothetical protein
MFTEFRTDNLESEEPIAADQADTDSTVLIEVDIANPSPTTIAFAQAIALLLANQNRIPEPAPKRPCRKQTPASQAPAALSKPQSTLSHHARHCTICHHPERQAIEEEFIHWHSPKSIASDYAVGARSVYRHARALGLFERRAAHLRDALGHIIEKVEDASITSDAVVRAVYAHSHLSVSGRWIEQPSLVVPSNPPASSEANRHTGRVEHDATH